MLGPLHCAYARLGHRMLCDKDGAAVFEGLDRCLKCSDLFGILNNIIFVESDQRAVNRQCADCIGRAQAVQGLTCHLADALACDQADGILGQRNLLRNPHHISAHDDCQFVMRALFVNGKLDVCKIHDVELDRTSVNSYKGSQVHDLLLCALACVGRSVEINRIDLDATLGNHVSGNRAVDSAGQKKCRAAVGADRHTAGAGHGDGIDKNAVAYFYGQRNFRVVHIHMHFRKAVEQVFAQVCRQFHGSLRETLVSPASEHFEAEVLVWVNLVDIVACCLAEFFPLTFYCYGHRTDCHDAEYMLQCFDYLLVIKGVHHFYIDSALFLRHFEGAGNLPHRKADLVHQAVLKQVAVLSLNSDFTVFYQKCFKHVFFLSSLQV